MEINNNNPAIKKDLYTRKKDKTDKSEGRLSSGSAEEASEVKTVHSTAQKSISRSQVLLAGLEHLKTLRDSEEEDSSKNRDLKDVIEKTVFDNLKVLEPMEEILKEAVLYPDSTLLEKLIAEESEKMNGYFAELGKSAVSEQNRLSIESQVGNTDPEALLQAVLLQLKEQGDPHTNLPSNRVLDLLGE